jgi:heavy metal translocating P-type ATPase
MYSINMLKNIIKTKEFFVVLSVVLLFSFYYLGFNKFSFSNIILSACIAFLALPLFLNMARAIYRGNFGVDILAGLAIISSLLIGQNIAAGIILIMLSGGEVLETYAAGRARASLSELLSMAPVHAKRMNSDGSVELIKVEEVRIGDTLVVSPMDIFPVNGIILLGEGEVDESMITGEPLPRRLTLYSHVHSGSINVADVVHIRAEATAEESTYASLIRLVKQAEESKAPMVRLADRVSVYFTLVALIITLLAFLFTKDPLRVVSILVVATPCPLILAAPIAFIAGMSVSAKRGIIVKHGGVFETISKANILLLDKTGTLTFGTPKVIDIVPINETFSKMELARIAGSLEQLSSHVVARSIISYTNSLKISLEYPGDFTETYGSGVSAVLGKGKFYIGSLSFLKSLNIESVQFDLKNTADMYAYISNTEKIIGVVLLSDVIRPGVKACIDKLSNLGYHPTLVTGDKEDRAEEVAGKLGFSNVYADCLPETKMEVVKSHQKLGETVIMVGDGINDAPALSLADTGIALGAHGTSAATDAADAVIVHDDITRLYDMVHISKNTMYIAKQSIYIGMGLSILAMGVAAFGYLPPVVGALTQEAIDVAVILNALRVLRIQNA